MLDEKFIMNILNGLYTSHKRGSELVKMDLEEVIADAIRQHDDEKENSENSSNLDLKDHK